MATDTLVSDRHPDVDTLAAASTLAVVGAALTGCGGGGGDDGPASTTPPPPVGPAAPPTDAEAARFLAQASMGASRAEIASVKALGYPGWLDAQFALPATQSRWDALVALGAADATYRNGEFGFDSVAWKKLLSGPDTLRQRIVLALSEIFVVSVSSLGGGGWKAFCGAQFLDLLESHAFGRHRELLQAVSLSSAMGVYLTYRGSAKANPSTGALPDENYARELMQLFTIGLVELNADGTVKLANGAATPTYGQDDIGGLARVFTGWEFDYAGQTAAVATATPELHRRPMVNIASRHEPGAKTFLGTTIPAGTAASTALATALDTVHRHANTGPFLARQLIQRLVTSNPSPAYVARTAAVFADDGSGVRGNLKAVVRALLLDAEARSVPAAAGAGKLREPILRFASWARALSVASASGAWNVGNTSDAGTRLAQSPLRSPSVFNFFRPGYLPPNTPIGAGGLVAPEFQITNESSVVGVVNFLQRAVGGSVGDLAPDAATMAALVALADDPPALLAELNVVLAAGRLLAATLETVRVAIASMATGSDATRTRRVQAALVLVLAAPESIVQA